MSKGGETTSTGPGSGRRFRRRTWSAVWIVAAVGVGILLLWLAIKVVLLFFASVLLAVFLNTLSEWVSRRTGLGRKASLGAVVMGLTVVFGVAVWLLAGPIAGEISQLSETLPEAIRKLEQQLQRFHWGRALIRELQNPSGLMTQAGNIATKATTAFSITIEGVVDAWIILFSGFYMATQPRYYVEGFLKLLPPSKRPRMREVLRAIGSDLRSWLFGQLFSMMVVGVLTWLGLLLLGVPVSGVLGAVAGLLDFIPVAGPWIAGVMAGLLALLKSPMHAVYVACLFVLLQFFEGHVLVPQVQKHATRLPPMLTILAMVLFYTLFGFFGLLLATPLLVVTLAAIRMLYVEDVLDESVGKGK